MNNFTIILDGKTPFQYPFEHDNMVQSDELQIGMKLIDGVWKFEESIEEETL